MALAVVMCCLVPVTGRAQDASDSAAYRALTQTPVAAVPLALSASMTGMASGHMGVAARYGLVSFASSDYIHSVAIGGDIRVGSGRLGAAAGVYHPTCDAPRCASHFMAEVSFNQRLVGLAMGRDTSSATLNIGVVAGVHRVFLRDGNWVAGLVLSYTRAR